MSAAFSMHNMCFVTGDGALLIRDSVGERAVSRLGPEFFHSPVVMASCGKQHSACVTEDGTLWLWGSPVNAQLHRTGCLGTADNPSDVHMRPLPSHISPGVFGASPAVMVACGEDFTLLLTAAGKVWGCGKCMHGQLGVDPADHRYQFGLRCIDGGSFAAAAA
jgi:hypothetical protein